MLRARFGLLLGWTLSACSGAGGPSAELQNGAGAASQVAVGGTASSSAGSSGGPSSGGPSSNAGAPQTSAGAGGADGGASSVGGGTAGTSSGGVETTGGGGAAPIAGTAGAAPTLPSGVTGLFPPPGAAAVCPDPALRLTFAGPPTLGTSGKLRVFDAAQPSKAVVTVDFAATSLQDTIGGRTFTLLRQVAIDGNTVVVNLPASGLARGKTYYVNLDSGAIVGPQNAAFALADQQAWRFSTTAHAPASSASLSVAADGGADFCSPQGALDAVPNGNTAPVTIAIAAGTYRGVVYFSGKQNLELVGADRDKVVISGVNNNALNPSTKGRALFGADGANGLVIRQLSIHNLTPQGGGQAEALRLEGCDKCQVRDANITSLQDTLLWSGRIYADHCYIAGNVDFIWGVGAAYFNACEIKTIGRSGFNVQARNGAASYGYVFVDSRITAEAGITGNTLARIDGSAYPNSHVAYIDCTLGSHISSAGWTITGGAPPASLRFWEYRSKNLAGALIDTSGRAQGSKQLSAGEAASMRDVANVLGGWSPPP